MPRATAAATLDSDSAAILYEGANMSQLSILLKMDDRVLKEKMHGIQPCGKRGNAAIYDVAEVAKRVGKLTAEQVNAAMQRLNHKDLPKELTKEYWAGLRSKQEYLAKEGRFWPTEHVVESYGDLFQLVKMSARLCVDAVERSTDLTERQRNIIKGQMDGMLVDFRSRVEQLAEKYSEERQHDDILDTQPEDADDEEL